MKPDGKTPPPDKYNANIALLFKTECTYYFFFNSTHPGNIYDDACRMLKRNIYIT